MRRSFPLSGLAGVLIATCALADDTRPTYSPPPDSAIPAGPLGDAIRHGRAIFTNTRKEAPEFVGNGLACSNCHLDAGRRAHSAPLGAAYLLYPAFRMKDHRISTFAERLRQCFLYSMNGREPPLGGEVLIALESYSVFLAKGAPVGVEVAGQGYPKLAKPAQAPDFSRGAAIFQQKCAACHGADGAGQKAGGQTIFPALWGPGSFNWGAGMTRISNAVGFIKANMPLGQGGSLSDQEAWDVAFFVDAHERPQDPRFTGSLAETRKLFHDTPMSLYGRTIAGVTLGANSPPSGPQER